MLWSKLSPKAFVLIVALVALSSSASESSLDSDILRSDGPLLEQRGYELTEAGLRKVFQNSDEEEWVKLVCVQYIKQEKMVGLLPEVKSYFAKIDPWLSTFDKSGESKMVFIGCILTLDKHMDQKTLDAYLTQIRRRLFEVSSEGNPSPILAYVALLDAQKGQGANIRDDLEFLIRTDIVKLPEDQIQHLFEMYGREMRDSDVDKLLNARKDQPKLQELILLRAKEHGLKLSTPTPEAP